MIEVLRAFRLGVVNLFGIGVPGLLILLFFSVGLVLPATVAIAQYTGYEWDRLLSFCQENRLILLSVAIIAAYVTGYVLRLEGVDDLDEVSAQKIYDENPKQRKDNPFFKPGEDDKFPYLHFRKYLELRHMHEDAAAVRWDDEDSRSKTAVNAMKLRIMHESPSLSAGVESNEAHVRLLSGTWGAIRHTSPLVFAGFGISLVATVDSQFNRPALSLPAIALSFLPCIACITMGWMTGGRGWMKTVAVNRKWLARLARYRTWLNKDGYKLSSRAIWAVAILLLLSIVLAIILLGLPIRPPKRLAAAFFPLLTLCLLGAMVWVRWRIEKLFHYRRIRELVYIVNCIVLIDKPTPLSALDLDRRTESILSENGITSIEELTRLTSQELLQFFGISTARLDKINKALKARGVELA